MGQAAATYTSQNAVDLVRKFVRDAPVTSLDSQVCDMVNSIMWTAYPWWWAQKALTAISCTDGVQDFALASGNNDLHRLMQLRIARTDLTPDVYNDNITIRTWLAPDLTATAMGNIRAASYDGINDKIRLERAINVPSGETIVIQGEYWYKPTVIADGQLSTALPFPNRYFNVYVEGIKWKFFQFLNDPRAGTAQMDKRGERVYTGQLGIFMDALYEMKIAEDYGDEGAEFPDDPIGARDVGVGFYG